MRYITVVLIVGLMIYLGYRLIIAAARSRARVLDHTRPQEPSEKSMVRIAYEDREPSLEVALNVQQLSKKDQQLMLLAYSSSASEVKEMLFDEQVDAIIINGEKPQWLKEISSYRIETEHGKKNVSILWRKYRGKEKRKMKSFISIIEKGNLYEKKEA